MKRLLIAAIAVAAIYGCGVKVEDDKDADAVWTYHGFECSTKVVEIEGHKYVLLHGYKMGGIVHAASCECKK